jgi:hypothetical protein
MKRRLILLVLLSPLLMADTCSGDDNPCTKPFPEVGAVVTTVEAAGDPCAGQQDDHILMWFTQGDGRYPLRCGLRDFPKTAKKRGADGRVQTVTTYSGGWGYLHIRGDAAADGTVGHGDPVNDKALAAAVKQTLDKGREALQGGTGSGNWRYTVRYNDLTQQCTHHWGFRVILAKAPPRPDGHPLGVLTAFYLTDQPSFYP